MVFNGLQCSNHRLRRFRRSRGAYSVYRRCHRLQPGAAGQVLLRQHNYIAGLRRGRRHRGYIQGSVGRHTIHYGDPDVQHLHGIPAALASVHDVRHCGVVHFHRADRDVPLYSHSVLNAEHTVLHNNGIALWRGLGILHERYAGLGRPVGKVEESLLALGALRPRAGHPHFPVPRSLRRGIYFHHLAAQRPYARTGYPDSSLVHVREPLGYSALLPDGFLLQGAGNDPHQCGRRRRRHFRTYAFRRCDPGLRYSAQSQSVIRVAGDNRPGAELRPCWDGGNDGWCDAGAAYCNLPHCGDNGRVRVVPSADHCRDDILRHHAPVREVFDLYQAHRAGWSLANARQRPGGAYVA